MLGRRDEDQGVVEERGRHHQRVGDRKHDEGQVDLARGHLGHQLVRARLHHGQVDAGVTGVELDQRRRQHALMTRLGVAPTARRPRAMPERARASAPVASTSASTRCMKGTSDGTVGRERDRPLARAAVEEENAQFVFEQAHLAREGGLGQVQPVGGPGETPFLGHGQGVGQLVQLHD